MSKFIFFYEGDNYPPGTFHSHNATDTAIRAATPVIHTTQMAMINFDLTLYHDYRIFVVFNTVKNPCEYPVVEFKTGCQVNLKEMRQAHNLYKIYRSTSMYAALDTFDQDCMFKTVDEVYDI